MIVCVKTLNFTKFTIPGQILFHLPSTFQLFQLTGTSPYVKPLKVLASNKLFFHASFGTPLNPPWMLTFLEKHGREWSVEKIKS